MAHWKSTAAGRLAVVSELSACLDKAGLADAAGLHLWLLSFWDPGIAQRSTLGETHFIHDENGQCALTGLGHNLNHV